MSPSVLARSLSRLIAVGVLVALVAAMSHVHVDTATRQEDALESTSAAPAAASSAPALERDDAHHEHSPTFARDAEPCLGCRTREGGGHAVSGDLPDLLGGAVAHHQGDTSPIPCDTTQGRLPGVRAPPPCRA